MEQKKLSRPNKFGELFLFQISYVLPGEYVTSQCIVEKLSSSVEKRS